MHATGVHDRNTVPYARFALKKRHGFCAKAREKNMQRHRLGTRELDPQNKLQFIRVRNKQHEIIVAPTGELSLIVVQQVVIAA